MTKTDVLLIEDDDDVALFLANVLDMSGYTIRRFATAEDALAAFESGVYLVGIIDIMLPGMHGVECAWKIRAADPGIYLIALSAVLEDWDDDDLTDNGFNAMFKKPFHCRDLLDHIDQATGHQH